MRITKIVPGMVPPTPRLRRTNGRLSGYGQIVRVGSSEMPRSFDLVRASSSEGIQRGAMQRFLIAGQSSRGDVGETGSYPQMNLRASVGRPKT